MSVSITALLFFTFAASVATMVVLIWAIQRRHVAWGKEGAKVIFAEGEEGVPEVPAQDAPVDMPQERQSRAKSMLQAREAADLSTRTVALTFLLSGVFWLLFGSVLGVMVALKFTYPDWLTSAAQLTFGRLRMMHLNTVIYGWASMGGIAAMLWMLPRLLGTPLRGARFALAGAWLWNLAMVAGVGLLAHGVTDGLEWLEFHWSVDVIFVIAGGLVAVPLFATFHARTVPHLYVSVWYIAASLLWFPALFLVANIPGLHFGVEQAAVNWWFAHNVLGLWLTAIGLALAYYLIPKVLGVPIYSYALSLIGFWALALFYSQAGIHHLIGGPVPTWLVTLSIVQSAMMVIPVVAVAINHHATMFGRNAGVSNLKALRWSPTLRFVVTGAVMYTAVSFVGSMQSFRAFNQLIHFTHFTVAHAHHGVYAFYSMILFGAVYFFVPRLMQREWPYPRLIRAHFWFATIGMLVYIVGLSIGGLLQGAAMLDASKPFMESVRVTLPYLHTRTVGGTLMTLSHLVFALHLGAMVLRKGPERQGAAWGELRQKMQEAAC